ncbi:hypothetical protein EGW08_009717, partial [Elysia chlorotica]
MKTSTSEHTTTSPGQLTTTTAAALIGGATTTTTAAAATSIRHSGKASTGYGAGGKLASALAHRCVRPSVESQAGSKTRHSGVGRGDKLRQMSQDFPTVSSGTSHTGLSDHEIREGGLECEAEAERDGEGEGDSEDGGRTGTGQEYCFGNIVPNSAMECIPAFDSADLNSDSFKCLNVSAYTTALDFPSCSSEDDDDEEDSDNNLNMEEKSETWRAEYEVSDNDNNDDDDNKDKTSLNGDFGSGINDKLDTDEEEDTVKEDGIDRAKQPEEVHAHNGYSTDEDQMEAVRRGKLLQEDEAESTDSEASFQSATSDILMVASASISPSPHKLVLFDGYGSGRAGEGLARLTEYDDDTGGVRQGENFGPYGDLHPDIFNSQGEEAGARGGSQRASWDTALNSHFAKIPLTSTPRKTDSEGKFHSKHGGFRSDRVTSDLKCVDGFEPAASHIVDKCSTVTLEHSSRSSSDAMASSQPNDLHLVPPSDLDLALTSVRRGVDGEEIVLTFSLSDRLQSTRVPSPQPPNQNANSLITHTSLANEVNGPATPAVMDSVGSNPRSLSGDHGHTIDTNDGRACVLHSRSPRSPVPDLDPSPSSSAINEPKARDSRSQIDSGRDVDASPSPSPSDSNSDPDRQGQDVRRTPPVPHARSPPGETVKPEPGVSVSPVSGGSGIYANASDSNSDTDSARCGVGGI